MKTSTTALLIAVAAALTFYATTTASIGATRGSVAVVNLAGLVGLLASATAATAVVTVKPLID
jgi:hypothetical protein